MKAYKGRLLQFTLYDTEGEPCLIWSGSIRGVHPLKAGVCCGEGLEIPQEWGERTRIDTSYGDMVMVKETVQEVIEAMKG